MSRTLVVDKGLKSFLPALTPLEREKLEAAIVKHGCLDPIRVWRGKNIIVDGHNRYEICKAHHIPFEVTEMEFETLLDVMEYMLENQDARRNWNDVQRNHSMGLLYNEREKGVGRPASKKEPKQDAPSAEEHDEAEAPGSTADVIAEEFQVSPATVKRAGKMAEVLTRLSDIGCEDLKARLLTKVVSSTATDLDLLGTCDKDTIKKVQTQCKNGKNVLRDAMAAVGVKHPKKPKPSAAAKAAANPKAAFAELDDLLGKFARQVGAMVKAQGGHTNHSKSVDAKASALSTAVIEWKRAPKANS